MKNLEITTEKIAKICNVSQGTVDRALNNRPDIKAETRQRILAVAKQYGYRGYVKTTPEKKAEQVGIIIFNLNNEYFSQLVTELEYVLRRENLGAVVMMSHYDKEYEIECIRNLYNMGVKGIVLCSVNSGKEFANYINIFDIPIVAVGNRLECLPYAGIDDFDAMRKMTKKVLKEKPENIIYFSPAITYNNAYAQQKRYEGFLSVIGDTEYTVVTDIEDIKECYDKKTVVICSNDYYALEVYFKAKNVRVTGFDNIRAVEKYKICIDTVSYSVSEIAWNAVEIIKKDKKESMLTETFIVEHS